MSAPRFPENLPEGWRGRLAGEIDLPYFRELSKFLRAELDSGQVVFPRTEHVLRALQLSDLGQVQVVILGQDPYHGPGQAVGLSFAVPNDLRPKPPSLQNIFKELESDLGVRLMPEASDLTGWARQGVLLLNTVLTVRQNQAFSHRDRGWESFTDRIIQVLNERSEPIVFLLWGAAASKKKAQITSPAHFILESAHPSPLSAHRGFKGSKPFSKINDILVKKLNRPPIDWTQVSVSC